jgi:hypothetical protein
MDTLHTLRDISVVLLAIQCFVVLLVPAALVYLMVRGLLWVQRKIRLYSPAVQGGFRRAATTAESASHRVASPVMRVNGLSARVRRMRDVL